MHARNASRRLILYQDRKDRPDFLQQAGLPVNSIRARYPLVLRRDDTIVRRLDTGLSSSTAMIASRTFRRAVNWPTYHRQAAVTSTTGAAIIPENLSRLGTFRPRSAEQTNQGYWRAHWDFNHTTAGCAFHWSDRQTANIG